MIFEFFYTLLLILIFARIIMPFFGMNHGPLYDNIYFYTEKILAPIRKRLPRSAVDWSPFVALIILNMIMTFFIPAVTLAVQGNFRGVLYLTIATVLSLLSSILSFFLIIFIVKIVNDHVNGQYSGLTYFINSLTYKPIVMVKQYMPDNVKKYTVWVILATIIILKMLIARSIDNFLIYFQ
ncbi:MAG: YggT family protein [Candidatus Delongbacteria bacterium]|nr:YggT family protein [Candidatus Delongbacteria bacterium]